MNGETHQEETHKHIGLLLVRSAVILRGAPTRRIVHWYGLEPKVKSDPDEMSNKFTICRSGTVKETGDPSNRQTNPVRGQAGNWRSKTRQAGSTPGRAEIGARAN